MKMYSVIGLSVVLLLAGGCDFLRSMAGRPTTEELLSLKQQAEEPIAPVAASEAEEEDPLPDFLSSAVSEEEGYLIIAGAYREPRHAERSAAHYRRLGYEVCIVRHGAVDLVGLCPTLDREEAQRSLGRLRAKGVCPKGSWIWKNR